MGTSSVACARTPINLYVPVANCWVCAPVVDRSTRSPRIHPGARSPTRCLRTQFPYTLVTTMLLAFFAWVEVSETVEDYTSAIFSFDIVWHLDPSQSPSWKVSPHIIAGAAIETQPTKTKASRAWTAAARQRQVYPSGGSNGCCSVETTTTTQVCPAWVCLWHGFHGLFSQEIGD